MKGSKPIFNDKDTWNMDATLAPIICEGLKKFKEVISDPECIAGYPCKVINAFDFGYGVEMEEDCIKEWHKIIDEMIYAFDSTNEPIISDYDFDLEFMNVGKTEQGYIQSTIKCSDEYEYDLYKKDMEEWEQRCEKGRELFAKYFKCLWR